MSEPHAEIKTRMRESLGKLHSMCNVMLLMHNELDNNNNNKKVHELLEMKHPTANMRNIIHNIDRH